MNWPGSFRGAGALTAWAACVAGACGGPRVTQLAQAPPTGALTVLTEVALGDSVVVASIVGAPDCSILVTDLTRGRIALVTPRIGSVVHWTIVEGGPPALRLDALDLGRVAAWSVDPPFLGIVKLQDLTVRPMVVDRHPWGGAAVGPLSALPGQRIAIAPIGDPDFPRSESAAHTRTSLLEIRDSTGGLLGSVGDAPERGGRYLSWLATRLAIGTRGDTVTVVSLEDALVSRYIIAASGRTGQLASTIPLLRYFRGPSASEEIRLLPWIHFGEVLHKFADAPQLGAAAIAPSGLIYVIRNYGFDWRAARDPMFRAQGAWQPTQRAIEAYGREGEFLAAYRLPDTSTQWIRVTSDGRLLLGGGGHMVIAQDPLAPSNCRKAA
jgi:hypothetical protein